MYARSAQFLSAQAAYIRKEQQRIDEEKRQLESLDRSPSAVTSGGAGDAVGGSITRKLSAHPVASLGKEPFKEKLSKMLGDNFKDVFDDTLDKMNSVASQVFGKLLAITTLDPNRALFDLAQRATEDLRGRAGAITERANELLSSANELHGLITQVLPQQGAWFNDPTNGFRKNITAAIQKVDVITEPLGRVTSLLEQGQLPKQSDLDELKDAFVGVREELVPLNADKRPSHGVDHPQAAALSSIGQLKKRREGLVKQLELLEEEHRLATQQKVGIQEFMSDGNMRTKGESMLREMAKTMHRFQEMSGRLNGSLRNAAGSSGTAAVFTHEEEWITDIESAIAILELPLLRLDTTSEDGGVFDADTAAMKDALEQMVSDMAGVADVDFSSTADAVRKLSAMASSCLNNTGLSVADADDLLSQVQSGIGQVTTFASSLESTIGSSAFLSGIVPKLGQVSSLLDTLRISNFDSAEELLVSGILYDDGVATASVRSVDSRGSFAEELRRLVADKSDVSELNRTRVERIHRVLETDERRKKRVATSYEDALEDAKEENLLAEKELEQVKRELEFLKQEIS